MKIDNSIVERIQKLLSLANSDNEHEAKMATQRANELLVKYNLSLQEVSDHQRTYQAQDLIDTGLTLKPYQKLIAQILMNFFFVKVCIMKQHVGYSSGRWGNPKAQYRKRIQLLGTKENTQIAAYIFSYLNTAFPHLWQDYFDRNSFVTKRDKVSYYTGLANGIQKMLRDTKWKVENETGLVVKGDPELEKWVEKHTGGGKYGSESQSDIDPTVYRDGQRDGAKINLRKPIASETNQDTTKRLSERDKT